MAPIRAWGRVEGSKASKKEEQGAKPLELLAARVAFVMMGGHEAGPQRGFWKKCRGPLTAQPRRPDASRRGSQFHPTRPLWRVGADGNKAPISGRSRNEVIRLESTLSSRSLPGRQRSSLG
jgi:hypothetical protein